MSGHIDPAFLRAFIHGEVSAEDAIRLLLDHLSHECPECRRALEEVARSMGLEDLQGQPHLPGTSLLRVLDKDGADRERAARDLASRLEEAGSRAPELVRAGEVEEYANPVLARILLSRTWEACKRRQPHAKALALATFEVGRKMSEHRQLFELSFDYRFAGLTLAANAARIADDFDAAFKLLEEAEEYMYDVADSAVESDFHRIRGRTCLDAGMVEEAELCAARAVEFGTECADNPRLAQTHLLLADVRRERGDLRGRISALEAAARFLDDSRAGEEDHLHFVVLVNLAVAWAELGEAEKAEQALKRVDPETFVALGQEGKLHWLRGLVARSKQDYSAATRELRTAQELFEAEHFQLEAGLVVLDLAATSLLAGNKSLLAAAVRDLAALSEKATNLQVATQLYMCWVAVQTDALTLDLIEDLHHRLYSKTYTRGI